MITFLSKQKINNEYLNATQYTQKRESEILSFQRRKDRRSVVVGMSAGFMLPPGNFVRKRSKA